MTAPPVFIVCSERSGSTMFWQMLDHHPDLSFVTQGEFDYAVALVGDDGTRPTAQQFRRWAVADFEYVISGNQWDESRSFDENVHAWLHATIGDSTARPAAVVHRHADRLPFLFDDAQYVHLVRDGRHVAESCVRLGWNNDLWHAASRWIDAETEMDRLREKVGAEAMIDVRYEDLVSDPIRVLDRICEFLGLRAAAEEMLAYSQRGGDYDAPNGAQLDRWRNWPEDDIRLVEGRIGDLLVSRGYEVSGLPPLAPSAWALWRMRVVGRLRGIERRIRLHGAAAVAAEFVGGRLGLASLRRWGGARRIEVTDQERKRTSHDFFGEVDSPLEPSG